MKKLLFVIFSFYLCTLIIISCNSNDSEEVKIGYQVWKRKNLSVSIFRNGDSIPHAKTSEEWEYAGKNHQPAWCYYNNDTTNEQNYGKLYNWYAVHDSRGLAPEGWHIPSDEEWNLLTTLYGSDFTAIKMKSTSGWTKDGNGTNGSGFTAYPGGNRSPNGKFDSFGDFGYWWSSTEKNLNYANGLTLGSGSDAVFEFTLSKMNGFSVRCVKD
jgi:uncharacterized protein (TIGR02145 family)